MSTDQQSHGLSPTGFLRKRGIAVPSVEVWLPMTGILAAELALYFGNIYYTLWGHFAVLLFCLAAPVFHADARRVYGVFLLVPLFRFVGFGMPTFFETSSEWLPLVYAALLPAVLLTVLNRERGEVSLLSRRGLLVLPVALALGVGFGEVGFRVLSPDAFVQSTAVSEVAYLLVVMVLLVALLEELLFRVLLQGQLEASLGRWRGLLVASVVFAAMHSVYGTLPAVLFGAALGLVLGLVYDGTDSLVTVVVLHGTVNVVAFGVLPIYGSLIG